MMFSHGQEMEEEVQASDLRLGEALYICPGADAKRAPDTQDVVSQRGVPFPILVPREHSFQHSSDSRCRPTQWPPREALQAADSPSCPRPRPPCQSSAHPVPPCVHHRHMLHRQQLGLNCHSAIATAVAQKPHAQRGQPPPLAAL